MQGRRKNWFTGFFDLSNWSAGISKKSVDTIEHLSTTNYWKAIPDADIKRYYFGIYYNPDIWIIRITTAWKELNNNYTNILQDCVLCVLCICVWILSFHLRNLSEKFEILREGRKEEGRKRRNKILILLFLFEKD